MSPTPRDWEPEMVKRLLVNVASNEAGELVYQWITPVGQELHLDHNEEEV